MLGIGIADAMAAKGKMLADGAAVVLEAMNADGNGLAR